MVLVDKIYAVFHDLVYGLDYAVRRKSSVFDGQVHGASREVHPDTELFCSCVLSTDQVSRIFRENIVMVEHCRAAVFHQLAHACQG